MTPSLQSIIEPQSRRLWHACVASGAGVFVAAVAGALGLYGTSEAAPTYLEAGAAVLAALAMWWAVRNSRRVTPRLAAAWRFLAVAFTAFAVGEISSAALALPLQPGPLGFLFAAIYMLFYPLFLLGTLGLPKLALTGRERWGLLLDTGIVMLAAGVVLWMLVIRPTLAVSGVAPFTLVSAVAYPLGDLALLWAILTIVLRGHDPWAMPIYRLLVGSAAVLILADLTYSYRVVTSDARVDPALDFGWTTSLVLAGLAAVRQALTVVSHASPEAGAPRLRSRNMVSLYLAYGCLVVAIAVVILSQLKEITLLSAAMVLGMLALVIARQVVAVRENLRLNEELARANDALERRVAERTAELAQANRELLAEIGERRRAEQRAQLQVERLAALHAIDTAISSGLDLKATLEVFLDQVVVQLEVDAAHVLLLDIPTGTLRSIASKGFGESRAHADRIPLGECPAGQAVLDRRTITVSDLTAHSDCPCRGFLSREPGLRSYWAVPLLAKGQVTGVLEVLSHDPTPPDQEWSDFLGTLAGQAAIAIDNRALFERTQRANMELAMAYDTTLQGWSRALELRDRETQGHALRVTELAERLARAMGLGEEALLNLRRGALLHDIGKMGVPDSILLKPGPLNEEEWVVMRRHAEYAFALLSPIEFLRPALDIPACHHESWDGSGYPRGLKGEEIPLAARIFAVVDTWDALSCVRPYRGAWPPEQVRAYIRERSGVQFDPAVVRAFEELSV